MVVLFSLVLTVVFAVKEMWAAMWLCIVIAVIVQLLATMRD